ncbi:hypothetical protein PGT21_026042 [Puccinia graminis f. sp. tritici]|uniref:Uncharacterized protein n=1 Tax=Puccinia graminis f. sp. tritici TaxID=56615 RepID=A0A5B0QXI1_PUCGR|nr:hypothetical protein PGT21_026042 [Puccinia graminis f. sp. tritici]KAA1134636.1 hypothetical protein PGTUg99_010771 [Puccinia graminis f. sp. tritici]
MWSYTLTARVTLINALIMYQLVEAPLWGEVKARPCSYCFVPNIRAPTPRVENTNTLLPIGRDDKPCWNPNPPCGESIPVILFYCNACYTTAYAPLRMCSKAHSLHEVYVNNSRREIIEATLPY